MPLVVLVGGRDVVGAKGLMSGAVGLVVDVGGGFRSMIIAMSAPPVREAKCWIRDSVMAVLRSVVEVGESRRKR